MAKDFNLVRDVARYPDLLDSARIDRWPDSITIRGTLEQAQFVAECLSNYEAGCDDYWFVEGNV